MGQHALYKSRVRVDLTHIEAVRKKEIRGYRVIAE